VEHLTARTIPINLATRFLYTIPVAVISVIHSSARFYFTLGIPRIRICEYRSGRSRCVIAKAGDLIVVQGGVGGNAQTFLRATGVCR
jgi:hypothetical protein